MKYQLPSGKVVHLTVEQYLDMTDADIEYMVRMNAGEYISSPFHGSVIRNTKKSEKEDIDEDTRIDYEPDLDEKIQGGSDADSCTDDDFDLPDHLVQD